MAQYCPLILSLIVFTLLTCSSLAKTELDEENQEAARLWDEYCPLSEKKPNLIKCDIEVGKVYFFDKNQGRVENPRNYCRSKFQYNKQADMVSVGSCDEYRKFAQTVKDFLVKNDLSKEKTIVYTSGYAAPVMVPGSPGGFTKISRWMRAAKDQQNFFQGDECMNIENKPSDINSDLSLLTLKMENLKIDSRYEPWDYPNFKSSGYVMCELFVPSKISTASPDKLPELSALSTLTPQLTEVTPEKITITSSPTDAFKFSEEVYKKISTMQPESAFDVFIDKVKNEFVNKVPPLELSEKIAKNLSDKSFVITDSEDLIQVFDITKNLTQVLYDDPKDKKISQRANFTHQVCTVFREILKPRNEKAWANLEPKKRKSYGQEILHQTEKIGFKLACSLEDQNKIFVDAIDIGLEAFSFKNISGKVKSFVFPSNTSVYYSSKTSHIVFPKGLDLNLISKSIHDECGHPAALGTLHKTLIHKLDPMQGGVRLASEIISFSFGKSIDNISVDVALSHYHRKQKGDRVTCAFWDSNSLSWNTSGCYVDPYSSSQLHTVCHCNHLTNFAILMDITGRQIETLAKTYITFIGLTLSTVCLILTVIFLFVVPSLKSRRSTITANICLCLLIVNLLIMFGVERTENEVLCRIISGLLLYSLASLFAWMLLEGYFLYQMIIVVFKASGYLQTKWLYLIGYGMAFLWLCLALSIIGFDGLYHRSSYYCWISNPIFPERIWVFAGPIIFVLAFNIVIFCKSIHVAFISKMNKNSIGKNVANSPQSSSIVRWFKGWVSLMLLLGLTWIAGFFYFHHSIDWISYIFITINSFQGVFIFVFEIVTNSKATQGITKFFSGELSKKYLRSSSQKTNSTNPFSSSSSRNGRSSSMDKKKSSLNPNPIGPLSRKKQSGIDILELS